jgi:hypothetical protein
MAKRRSTHRKTKLIPRQPPPSSALRRLSKDFCREAGVALDRARFAAAAEHLCRPAIHPQPAAVRNERAHAWTPAGTYGRLLLVAVLSGARSERALCELLDQDRTVREFVAGADGIVPGHSTIARLRKRLGHDAHLELLTLAFEALAAAEVGLGRDGPDEHPPAHGRRVRHGSGVSYRAYLENLFARALVRSGYDEAAAFAL